MKLKKIFHFILLFENILYSKLYALSLLVGPPTATHTEVQRHDVLRSQE